jgi:hypothetical protein
MEYLFWGLAGWCGTPWRRWPPPPDPEPWWWVVKVIAVLGGIGGGILANNLLEGTEAGALHWIATVVGAMIVGRVVSEIANELGGKRGAANS